MTVFVILRSETTKDPQKEQTLNYNIMILSTMILQAAAGAALGKAGAALGAAIAAIAAAIGIGKIGKSTMEAIARQPESAGNLRTSMIIAAGMVEGAALFAIIVALLAIVIQ